MLPSLPVSPVPSVSPVLPVPDDDYNVQRDNSAIQKQNSTLERDILRDSDRQLLDPPKTRQERSQ